MSWAAYFIFYIKMFFLGVYIAASWYWSKISLYILLCNILLTLTCCYLKFVIELSSYHKHAFHIRVKMQESKSLKLWTSPWTSWQAPVCLSGFEETALLRLMLPAGWSSSLFWGRGFTPCCPLHLPFTAEPVGQKMPCKAAEESCSYLTCWLLSHKHFVISQWWQWTKRPSTPVQKEEAHSKELGLSQEPETGCMETDLIRENKLQIKNASVLKKP